MPKRDPQTGQFKASSGGGASSGQDIHRASGVYQDDGSDTLHESAMVFQAADTDRTIVGIAFQMAGDPGYTGEGYQLSEVSFDTDAELLDPGLVAGESEEDDMRSPVLAMTGIRHSSDTGVAVNGGPSYTPLQATWRRGTEVFVHSIANTSGGTLLRVTVYYVEN